MDTPIISAAKTEIYQAMHGDPTEMPLEDSEMPDLDLASPSPPPPMDRWRLPPVSPSEIYRSAQTQTPPTTPPMTDLEAAETLCRLSRLGSMAPQRPAKRRRIRPKPRDRVSFLIFEEGFFENVARRLPFSF